MNHPNASTNTSAVAPQQQQHQLQHDEPSLDLLDPLSMAGDMSMDLDGFQSDALYLCNLLSTAAPADEKIPTSADASNASQVNLGRLSFTLQQNTNKGTTMAKRHSSIVSLSSEDQRELEQAFAEMNDIFEPTPIELMSSSNNNNPLFNNMSLPAAPSMEPTPFSVPSSIANAFNSNNAMKNGFPEMDSIQLPDMPKIILPTSTSTPSLNAKKENGNSNNTDNSDTDAGAGPRFRAFHEKKWDERLLELRAFRQQHGHSLVPHTYPSNPQLARWVKRQRRQHKLMEEGKQSTMTPERCELLESLGFVWDSHQAAWSEKIQDLRRYQAQNGHCLVPSSYKANPQLATWVKCQRRQYKLYWEGRPSAMTPQRIAELEGMGFVWELRSAASTSSSKAGGKKVTPSADILSDDEFESLEMAAGIL
jgi:hypothetical protein